MTPAQLLARLKRRELAPAYLLLGPEAYGRRRVREALAAAVLGAADPAQGLAQHDLGEMGMVEVLDDARSLSLFATERLIFVANAEAALPRASRGEEDGEEAEAPSAGGAGALAVYLKDPSPGVVLVFEAVRFDFEGEDKRRLERVRKFYAAVPEVVELRRFSSEDAHAEAQTLVRRAGLAIEPSALDLLVEALGDDVARVALEIEKLTLYAGHRTVTEDDIVALVPDARATNVFALVAALGRRDRARSLDILDTLCREGEYLPLALAFLSTQFRMALVAKEAGLRGAAQIQGHFSRLGITIWGSRAEQVQQTVTRFSKTQIERALESLFDADKAMRSTHPDDRIVMEQFVLKLTAVTPA
jgi:DNA polymerase-3 subunit delta